MRLQMPVSISIEQKIEIDTVFGDARIEISGPKDKDKDGDPEVTIKVDLPGKSFDFYTVVELPMTDLLSSPLSLASHVLSNSNVPGAKMVSDVLSKLTGNS